MAERRTSRTNVGRLLLVASGVFSLLSPLVHAQEGGIEVFAAETLFSSGTRLSTSHIYQRKGTFFRGRVEIPDPQDRTLEEHRFVAAIDHGVRRDLTLSALIPFVAMDLDSNAGDARSRGLGDVALLAKYRAYKQDWKRGAWHVSAIGGVELPSGETRESEAGLRLSPGLQPGSGAWNPFLGLATNLNLDRLRFDALAFFKWNNEGAQDFEKGDFLALEVDAAYRFLHTKYPGPTASAKLGLQWRDEGRAQQGGVTVLDSGSRELRLRSGLTWHPAPNLDISLAVDVPLEQHFEGQQLGLDYRTFLALGIRF